MTDEFKELLKKIDAFSRKYYLNKVFKGMIWWLSLLMISAIFLIVLEYFNYFKPALRTFFAYTFLSSNILFFWLWIGQYLLKFFRLGKIISHEQAANIIGKHFNEIDDKLLNAIQLQKAILENPNQKILIEASIKQKIESFRPIKFVSAIRLMENKKYLKYALFPIFLFTTIAILDADILKNGAIRMINYQTYYKKMAPFQFKIMNKKMEATEGDDFILAIAITGNEIPNDVYLDNGINTFKLIKKDITHFEYRFRNLQNDIHLQLFAGEFSSDEYLITVKKRPALLNMNIDLIYPTYIKKKNVRVKNPGDLIIPAGTLVKWQFKTENVISMVFKLGKKSESLNNNQNNYQFKESILKSTSYSISFNNDNDVEKNVLSHQINVIVDEYPKIDLIERADSVNADVIYFVGKGSDDYGLSSLNFNYLITKSSDQKRVGKSFKTAISIDKASAQSNFIYLWNLKKTGILADEEVSYYFDLADNDGVYGPKHIQSIKKIYRLPSIDEIQKNINKTTSDVKQKMQTAINQSEKISREAKKINQSLMDQKTISFEQKKNIEQLINKQQQLESIIREIQKESKENLQKQKELNLAEKTIYEKQKQIQDLFDNVLNDQTKKLLNELQKLMDQNQKALTEDQLKQVQIDQKSLQKELDRILELYKKLEIEQNINQAIEQLHQIAQKQEKISKESSNNLQETKEKQENLKQQFDQVKKDLKDIANKNQQLEQPSNFQNPEKEANAIQEKMEEATKNLEQKKSQKASQYQKETANQVEKLAQKLEQMQQEGQEQENNVNAQDLRQILQNLLKLSFDEENVTNLTKNINDPRFVKVSQQQKEIIDNLKIVEDSLSSLGKRVPQLKAEVNKEIRMINEQLAEAVNHLSNRKISDANRNQQFALTSINNLALLLSEALQQLQDAMKNAKSGGKGKPQPNLTQLSQMQKELNKNMQKAKEQMHQQGIQPGQKGSSSMSEQMAKMAQQQQQIRQTLEQINNNLNKDGKGKLGDLEKIMNQMEQTETDLVNKRISQEALIRQQDIQTRLLAAENAEKEREQDEQRESKAGKDFTPNYNLILLEFQKQKTKELEQIKTVPPSLNYFYKLKISEYFKKLNSVN
jgi:hypothetical protein